ncbi:LytTR family DNA-binding domain-containing protein [uncultured Sphingomonas sp.]|uniref:LytTR family DNA-binding domain-containing protein n=1 Tax=uncultured Sphingomonas sp. TaxID=158754 RepID=UPI0035CC4196
MRDFASLQGQDWWTRMTGRAGLAMLFAAILAFLAPFGTYRFDVMGRVGYWTVQMAAWLVLSAGAEWVVSRLPRFRSQSSLRRRIVETGIATFPMIVVVGVANNMMNGWLPYPDEVVELFVSIALIGGGFTYVADRVVGGLVGTHAGTVLALAGTSTTGEVPAAGVLGFDREPLQEEQPSDTALIQRLPAHVRVDIICLQVEDHYVRVHSRLSSAMILMRFSDALRGVDHIPGSQVHRSWWVAASAVEGVRRTGRTAQITLCNGLSVPVSAPYLSHVTTSWGSMETSAA